MWSPRLAMNVLNIDACHFYVLNLDVRGTGKIVTMTILTPLACRAARALLEMSARELGDKSGVALETINKFENGRPMRESTKAKLSLVFDSAGVEILNGNAPGARLRTLSPLERQNSAEKEDVLRSLVKLIEACDAAEDAGVVAFDGSAIAKLSLEEIQRLLNDPRWPKDDES
jgi:transcriptional regulator with XRE-family HTH domain